LLTVVMATRGNDAGDAAAECDKGEGRRGIGALPSSARTVISEGAMAGVPE